MESIKSNELRIGNLIEHKAIMCEVLSIDNEWLQIDNDQLNTKIIDCKPIPLTEEWLLKFGFKKFKDKNINYTDYRKNNFVVILKEKFTEVEYIPKQFDINSRSHMLNVDKLYVHQLQNLYFALTGEELTIK